MLVAFTLFARITVPTGFMPVATATGLVMQVCGGFASLASAVTDGPVAHDAAAMAGMARHQGDREHGKTESPCVFAGLSMPSLSGADPVLLAAAILFIVALGRVATRGLVLPQRQALRPPLRGPPARA